MQTLARQKHMPTPKELAHMQEDLNFKQNEMQKSEATASNLAGGKTKQIRWNYLKKWG